jgi:hypothetical protein
MKWDGFFPWTFYWNLLRVNITPYETSGESYVKDKHLNNSETVIFSVFGIVTEFYEVNPLSCIVFVGFYDTFNK